MSQFECWMRFAAMDAIKFPKELDQFEGYLIAQMVIDTVIIGGRNLRPGMVIMIKGNMPSMHPAFRYHLRFKYNTPKPNSSYTEGDYELLPKAGFKGSQRIPWTLPTLTWSLNNEVIMASATIRSETERALLVLSPPGLGVDFVIEEDALRGQFFYGALREQSDYYRLSGIMMARKAFPGSITKIRKMPATLLARLTEHLNKAPHELCFYGHSGQYGLGEMSAACFREIMDEAHTVGLDTTMTTKPLQMAAVAFYGQLKEARNRFGHTIFKTLTSIDAFSRSGGAALAPKAHAAMHWLTREGHLLFLDAEGICLPKERWFEEPSLAYYLQFPRDDQLKERITGHLRRIFRNFLETSGTFSLRQPSEQVPAVPGGPLNERQRMAMDHIIDNPLTIIQGGPGSGKTFEGVDHLASIFQWTEILTHVGRQAVSLCDRLGGNTEIACTIHSAYHRQKDSAIRVAYNAKKEILILDEVYNADEWTFEKALAIAPNASRLVMVGDPDQIRPIPDEKGAGTPALDIARAFPQHVIFLNENMRQRENARAIHEVVTAVRTKQPRAIQWSNDLQLGAAVLVRPPPAAAFKQAMFSIIQRLRRDIGKDEHAWQMVTLFNGNKPEVQGMGVIQLNEMVEEYLKETGHFTERLKSTGKLRVSHKITNRLSMYVGFKFMITDKFIPDPSLNGGKKKKRGDMYAARRPVTLKPGKKQLAPEPEYTETRNGQIEVVASIRQITIKGTRGSSWLIECVPKGKCVLGARLLLNRKLHVDPSKLFAAWVVTGNKSMGGECKNVGVYLPSNAGSSGFDRSHLYVMVSRPIDFLCVMANQPDIDALCMRDPKPVDSGLYTRLRTAKFVPETEPKREAYETQDIYEEAMEMRQHYAQFNWKDAHNTEEHGSVVPELKETLDIYDQSTRVVARGTVTACPVSYKAFSQGFKQDLRKMVNGGGKKHMKTLMEEYHEKVYGGIPDNVRRFPPFGQPEIPAIVEGIEEEGDDNGTPIEGGESETKRHKSDDSDDDDEGAFVSE